MSVRSPSEEKFDRSLYKSLLSKDQEIIDEYMQKMSAGDLNSFMRRFIEHYSSEAIDEILEVDEDKDSVIVFENTNISKTDSLNNFIEKFILSTKSSDDINAFFIDEKNFNYITQNIKFYKNNLQVINHIIKHFRLNRSLRPYLENQKELNSFIWEGFRAYFENKKIYRGDIYAYIGSVVHRKLKQNFKIGFVCPFCSAYYIRDSFNKDELIECNSCHNKFTFAGVKCPAENCGKIVPLTSIDLNTFEPNNVKHMRAFQELGIVLGKNNFEYLTHFLNISVTDDMYKIPISEEMKRKKLNKLVEYELSKDTITNVSEFLFYLPLICPITTGYTKTKYNTFGEKHNFFKGCGNKFFLKDGLQKFHKNNYVFYKLYDQRRVRYAPMDSFKKSYNDAILLQPEETIENKIPYDRIWQTFDKYLSKVKFNQNKSAFYLLEALKKYFKEEYNKSIELAINTYMSDLTNDDLQYIKNIDNYLSDIQLQNNLYYKNSSMYRIGWIPNNDIQKNVRKYYIELVQQQEDFVRKIINAKLPFRFYTYRIDDRYKKQKIYKKRLGIAINKEVLPATKRASAGYGPNFKMDKEFIDIKLLDGDNFIDLKQFVKNGVYWSPENATLHGFDNKTGIIWFDGSELHNTWRFPNGLIVNENSEALVDAICVPDSFSKMFQRFNLNDKMRQIVSELETEGFI